MHLQTKSTPQNAKYRAKVLFFFELTKFYTYIFVKNKVDFTKTYHAKTTTGDIKKGGQFTDYQSFISMQNKQHIDFTKYKKKHGRWERGLLTTMATTCAQINIPWALKWTAIRHSDGLWAIGYGRWDDHSRDIRDASKLWRY